MHFYSGPDQAKSDCRHRDIGQSQLAQVHMFIGPLGRQVVLDADDFRNRFPPPRPPGEKRIVCCLTSSGQRPGTHVSEMISNGHNVPSFKPSVESRVAKESLVKLSTPCRRDCDAGLLLAFQKKLKSYQASRGALLKSGNGVRNISLHTEYLNHNLIPMAKGTCPSCRLILRW